MTESDWALDLIQNVAKELKRLRIARGWSVAFLAKLTEQAGHPIGASVISNFEYGRRGTKLEVTELLILAQALDVPPGVLLFPGYPARLVSMLPPTRLRTFDFPSYTATEWLAGRVPSPRAPEAKGELISWAQGTNKWVKMVELIEQREALANTTNEFLDGPLAEVIHAGLEHVPYASKVKVEEFLSTKAQNQQQIEELSSQIEALGGYVGGKGDDATGEI